jgi:thiol-disulfide isomerase/thioredoxin
MFYRFIYFYNMYKTLTAILIGCFNQLPAQQPFTVNVQLKGAKDGTQYFLQYTDANAEIKDSARVLNNSVTFKGQLVGDAIQAWVMGNFEGQLQYRSFWLSAGLTTITQNTKILREAIVTGSPVNEHAAELNSIKAPYEKEMEKIEDKAEKIAKKGKSNDDLHSYEQAYEALEKKSEQAERNYIRKYPERLYSLGVLHGMSTTYGADSTKELFNLMPDSFKQSSKGQDIQKYLLAYRKIAIGLPFAEVMQPDTSGKPFSLSSKTGKWILLEFWASWCGPCRAENPELVKVFDTFKEKGFDIYAVSLDTDKDKWIEAIKKDKLPWWHVSDLRGSYNEAALTYSISGIPDNMLINPEGVIAARGLNPDQLKKYLEKELD